MRLVKWTPSHSSALGMDFDGLMKWAFRDFENGTIPTSCTRAMSPAMDIEEEQDRYLLTFDLPGWNKDDVRITFEDGILTLKGEAKEEIQTETESKTESKTQTSRFHRRERFRGSFERTLRLPEKVDPEKMEARFKDGVLELSLPFLPEAKPRKIEIKVADE